LKFFVVLGLGQFGRHVATSLHDGGGEVLAIDRDEKSVEAIKDKVEQAVCMNATDIHALRAVGADKAQTAVVALGESDLESSILACAALSDIGVEDIIVRAANELHGRILMRVGATRLVYPEKQMGEQIAKSILMSGAIDQVTLSTGQVVAQIHPKRELIGKTLKDAQLRANYEINVIGIQRPETVVDDNGETHERLELESVPGPEARIDENDILIVVGKQAARTSNSAESVQIFVDAQATSDSGRLLETELWRLESAIWRLESSADRESAREVSTGLKRVSDATVDAESKVVKLTRHQSVRTPRSVACVRYYRWCSMPPSA